jgi:signal transduction histidine kinase
MISRPPRFDFLPNDLHVVLDEVILMHEVNARQQNVIISKQYLDQKILANVDRDQLKQVFHNILINALQAMPRGGNLEVRTSIGKIKGKSKRKIRALHVEFSDTGVGIPADRLKDIFEFYYTSKKTGTGLGLAIARQIVEGHSGTIKVESTYGQGTRIKVIIPLRSQETSIKEKRFADVR